MLLVHVGSQQGLFSSFLIFLGVMMRHFDFTGFILYLQKFVTDYKKVVLFSSTFIAKFYEL